MSKHKLIELQNIIELRIGALKEEVEIGTNVKLNPLYIADRRDEIQFLQCTTRIIQSILTPINLYLRLEKGFSPTHHPAFSSRVFFYGICVR